MAEITINIDDYLSDEEKKDLCIEYVRETLRSEENQHHKERVLSNMAYNAAYKILDDSLTEEDMLLIKERSKKVLQSKDSYLSVFRKADHWGSEDSRAYLEVKKAVEEHKHLINGLVKEVILTRDYEKDLGDFSEYLGEVLIEAVVNGLKND